MARIDTVNFRPVTPVARHYDRNPPSQWRLGRPKQILRLRLRPRRLSLSPTESQFESLT